MAGRHSTVSPNRPGGAGARAWTAGMAACITTGCEALDSALGNGMGAVRARCGRAGCSVRCVRRLRRLRRFCGQELRLVQLCSSHERSGQKFLAVQLPASVDAFASAWLSPTARYRVLNSLSSAR